MSNEDIIYNEIVNTSKYKFLNRELIRKIVIDALPKYKTNKQRIKAVKTKLHQIHEAYLKKDSNNIAQKFINEKDYKGLLTLHTSTNERLPFYKDFYKEVFEITGIPNSILDIACGYNPFAIEYMNLPKEFRYYAYDINEKISNLLNDFFMTNHYDGISHTLDLTMHTPSYEVDVALVLKFLPLVEQIDNKRSLSLLEEINAMYIVVSFPTRTLTGKNIGMAPQYKRNFETLIHNKFDIIKIIEFKNEIVFIIKKV